MSDYPEVPLGSLKNGRKAGLVLPLLQPRMNLMRTCLDRGNPGIHLAVLDALLPHLTSHTNHPGLLLASPTSRAESTDVLHIHPVNIPDKIHPGLLLASPNRAKVIAALTLPFPPQSCFP